MLPPVVRVGALLPYVPFSVSLYVIVVPLGLVTLTFAQLCALPLYDSFFVDALAVILAFVMLHVKLPSFVV